LDSAFVNANDVLMAEVSRFMWFNMNDSDKKMTSLYYENPLIQIKDSNIDH